MWGIVGSCGWLVQVVSVCTCPCYNRGLQLAHGAGRGYHTIHSNPLTPEERSTCASQRSKGAGLASGDVGPRGHAVVHTYSQSRALRKLEMGLRAPFLRLSSAAARAGRAIS